jgi:putative peptide zinc metalloprotease protein
MKMGFVGPSVIRPATFALQWLFWPPVLVTMLALSAAALGWMYGQHGVGNGIHEVFYNPQLMLGVLGLVILCAVAHEFGHAAALRYGGGEARQMGVGLYMVYPAFFTDVTDSYRLRRWGKVRTDAGGLYFNLLFCLALVGVALATGQDWPLFAVAIINLEMVHQLLPVGRMDGYWALADLVGLPDFFSRMMPFLRSVLPSWIPISKGQKLPDLKPRAKVIFALYMALIIPLLLGVLFIMLRTLPRIIATGVDGIGVQISEIARQWEAGQTSMMLLAVVQMLIVSLATFGVLYVVARLGVRTLREINRWSRPTPFRRAVGTMGSTLAVAGLVVLWVPQVPMPGGGETSGPLYSAAGFRPIEAGERLTVGDAVRDRTVVRSTGNRGGEDEEDAANGTEATPTTSPSAPPSQGPGPSGAVSPSPAKTPPQEGTGAAPTPPATPKQTSGSPKPTATGQTTPSVTPTPEVTTPPPIDSHTPVP